MLKRILFLLIANIVAISSFCQVTLTQEEYNKLPEDVKKELSISKEMKKYSDYAIIASAATFISSMIAIFS